MIQCKYCGKEINQTSSASCPHCGMNLLTDEKNTYPTCESHEHYEVTLPDPRVAALEAQLETIKRIIKVCKKCDQYGTCGCLAFQIKTELKEGEE